MKQMLYFPPDILIKLKKAAASKGLSMSAYVRMILIDHWDREKKSSE